MTVSAQRSSTPTPSVAKTQTPTAKKATADKSATKDAAKKESDLAAPTVSDAKVDAAIQTATRQLTQVMSKMVADSIVKHIQGAVSGDGRDGKVATGLSSTKADNSQSATKTSPKAIARGDKGPEVSELQQALNKRGANLAVDGKFGPKTEAAVQAYQRESGAAPTGKIGDAVASRLGLNPSTTQTNTPPVVRGDRGPRVVALQQALNAGGATLKVDGKFGEQTETAVQAYQRNAGSAATGVVDGAMADKLNLPAPPKVDTTTQNGRASGPFARTKAGRTQQAEALLKQNGVQLREGKSYVVQIDQDTPPSSASARDKLAHIRSYTGQTSVFRAQGGRLVEVAGPFDSASHPGQTGTRRRSFTDVNRDGKDDIPHLRSGTYEYNKSTNYRGRFNPKSDRTMKVARDLNQDGAISAAEDKYALDRDLNGSGMQWHAGLANRPRSVGCQTMSPADYKKFTRAVQQGAGNAFTYVLARRPNEKFGANPL